jgi:hypothetical protein
MGQLYDEGLNDNPAKLAVVPKLFNCRTTESLLTFVTLNS